MSTAGGRWGATDVRTAVALLYTGAMLTALEYGFLPTRVQARLDARPGMPVSGISLEAGLIWAGGCVAGYLVLPTLLVLLLHRSPLRSVGWNLKGFLRHLPVYLGLFAVMAPVVWWASRQDGFAATYPFVRSAAYDWSTFLRWEAGYVLQFFALESFFRGYLLFTLEERMGHMAIFVMAVPYCMIHYHKPPLEALGALGAGVILGWLALRYRSWLGGAVLHTLVALSMDGLAAHRAGLF